MKIKSEFGIKSCNGEGLSRGLNMDFLFQLPISTKKIRRNSDYSDLFLMTLKNPQVRFIALIKIIEPELIP